MPSSASPASSPRRGWSPKQPGVSVELGGTLRGEDRRRLADALVDILVDYVSNRRASPLVRAFLSN